MDEAETMQLIRHLEEEARVVREKLTGLGRRPLVVEFSGTPKAGKSTVINILRLFLARNDIKPYVLTERASTCPIRSKTHLFFNVWTACSTLAQMLDASQDGSLYDVVIMDRGLFDALVWMRWLESSGQLSDVDRQVIQTFFTLPHWRNRIDLLFVMDVSPEEALNREFGEQVTRKHGSIMNPATILEFNEALRLALDEDSELFPDRLIRISTTGVPPRQTGYEVVKKTLEALDNLTNS